MHDIVYDVKYIKEGNEYLKNVDKFCLKAMESISKIKVSDIMDIEISSHKIRKTIMERDESLKKNIDKLRLIIKNETFIEKLLEYIQKAKEGPVEDTKTSKAFIDLFKQEIIRQELLCNLETKV